MRCPGPGLWTSALVLGVTVLGGCTGAADARDDRAASSSPADTGTVPAQHYTRRVVVFMEASAAEIDAVRAELSEADFAVVADDLMFYRAAAHEFLAARGLPVVRVVGRRPLAFRVQGIERQYDYAGSPWLDVIVLYDVDREPHAIPPIEVELADAYFGTTSPDSAVGVSPTAGS